MKIFIQQRYVPEGTHTIESFIQQYEDFKKTCGKTSDVEIVTFEDIGVVFREMRMETPKEEADRRRKIQRLQEKQQKSADNAWERQKRNFANARRK